MMPQKRPWIQPCTCGSDTLVRILTAKDPLGVHSRVKLNPKIKGVGQECPSHTSSNNFNLLIRQLLIILVCAGQFERISQRSLALFDAGDDVGAAKPVGFSEVGGRPLRGVVGMGVVEADDVLFALAAFALDAYQFLGIDVVAVLGRVSARVSGAGEGCHNASPIIVRAAEQHTTAFVGIGFLAVLAKGVVMGLSET